MEQAHLSWLCNALALSDRVEELVLCDSGRPPPYRQHLSCDERLVDDGGLAELFCAELCCVP